MATRGRKEPLIQEPEEFVRLKAIHHRNRRLYKDTSFNICNDAFLTSESDILFKRPYKICKKPQFITNGIDRFDVNQGSLGDCWLLAAIASLTLKEPAILNQVVPQHQTFAYDEGYFGAFYFRLWSSGKWEDVIIDDRLPCKRGPDGVLKLILVHSQDRNEFWCALLEKACAKLYGGYEKLHYGYTSKALENFTGDVFETIDLKKITCAKDRENVFSKIWKCRAVNSTLLCTVITNSKEHGADLGLVDGHAYSVTGSEMVQLKDMRNVCLLRVRNPWGQHEWKGAWSDYSARWQQLEVRTRDELLKRMDDGEFWMSLKDFCKYFTHCFVQQQN